MNDGAVKTCVNIERENNSAKFKSSDRDPSVQWIQSNNE